MTPSQRACKWAKEHPEEHAAKAKLWRKRHPDRKMLQGARERAKNRKVPININVEDIIIPELCPILGTPLIQNTSYAASLDRINPDLGYTKDNIQVISRKANRMKNDATPEELRRFAEWVIKTYPA